MAYIQKIPENRLPAKVKKKFIINWAWPISHPNSGKTGEKQKLPQKMSFPNLEKQMTLKEIFTSTQITVKGKESPEAMITAAEAFWL